MPIRNGSTISLKGVKASAVDVLAMRSVGGVMPPGVS